MEVLAGVAEEEDADEVGGKRAEKEETVVGVEEAGLDTFHILIQSTTDL